MSEHIDPEWLESLRRMTPEEQISLLRAIRRLRIDCPHCPVKSPQLNRKPCHSCTSLPGNLGRPLSTVN
jgi:hypothetical protein